MNRLVVRRVPVLSLNGQRDETVVLRNVALQNVCAGSQHTLETVTESNHTQEINGLSSTKHTHK